MAVALAILEPQKMRRQILYMLAVIGLWLSGMYSYYLLQYGVSAAQLSHHICYTSPYFDSHAWFWGIPYLAVVALPFFVSSVSLLAWLGVLLIISCAVTILFWTIAFTSVWCFFAAILSASILYVLKTQKI